jgi:hypothetical protein
MSEIPLYVSDILSLLRLDFDDPHPVPHLPVPGGTIGQRIEEWRKQRRGRRSVDLCVPRPGGPLHVPGATRRRHRVVPPEEYYPVLLGHRLTGLSVLLHVDRRDNPFDIRAVEDAVLATFEGTYGGLLTPPLLLDALEKAARGKRASLFCEVLEEARTTLSDPTVGGVALSAKRLSLRFQALELAADAELAPGQVQALELFIDTAYLEAAARLDVQWAQHRRLALGAEDLTCRQLLRPRHERDESLFDQHVPLAFRAIPYSRLPTVQRERVEAYLRSRAPDLPTKILDPGWKPDLRRRRAVHGPALSQPAVVGELRWPPVRVAPSDSSPRPEPEPTTPPSPLALVSSRKEAATSPAPRTFAEIHAELSAELVGREDLVNDLAMSVYLHAQGVSSRLLLTGPSGSGKTFAATAMARAAGVPVAIVSATDIVETGYRGLNVGDLLRPLYEAAGSLERMATAALVVDELGKLRMPAMLADTVGYQKRRGQQESLLGLIGGGTPVHFHTDGGHKQIDTSKMLIVLTDAFADCDWTGRRPPTTGDLIRAGIIPELAERVGQSIQLRPRSVQDLVALFKARRDGLLAIQEVYAKLGYTLEIADTAYGMVAYAVASEDSGIGPRSGMTLLVQAARRRLIPLLHSGAPAGTTVILTPDDVPMPPPGDEEGEASWK